MNNVRLQDAKFCELVTAYRQTVIRANAEAEDGIVEFLQSQLQAKALQRSVDAATRAVKIATAQYEGGEVDFNRVALLEQNLVQQQDLLAQAQGDIAIGLVHTYRALGGGWEVDCEAVQGVSIGSQIADVANSKSELVPPGTSSSGPNAAPEAPALSSGATADTAIKLRYANDQSCIIERRDLPTEAADRSPILDHAVILSSDRGESRWRR